MGLGGNGPGGGFVKLTKLRVWTLAGSNRLPLLCHRSALPTELRALAALYFTTLALFSVFTLDLEEEVERD